MCDVATTGFWPVKGSLKDVVNYADNPDKTTNPKYLDKDLANSLKYVENDSKTDMKMFVSGINCPTVKAYEQMIATKRRYGKLGGNVAYHGYQSFKSGEVTPEEAHKIGIETVKRMWGGNYEIVVTTHLNTENIHNHFVVNSVSFKTGRKFENHISDHIRLREISDEVCKEFNKSVIKNAKFYNSDKKSYWIHKQGKKTHRDILRDDVDFAVKTAGNLMEFERIMINMGYSFNRNIMSAHPSVIAKGWQRPVRIDSLGEKYSTEKLVKRIADNKIFVSSFAKSERVHKAKPKHTPLAEIEYQLRRVKYMDTLEAMFYLLLELLKPSTPTPNYKPPLSPAMRQEVRKFKQYQKQFRLLHDENISTVPELELFIFNLSKQIDDLEKERSKADNKRRRAKADNDKEIHKAEMRNISVHIKPLRDKLKTAKAALDSVPQVQRLLEIERDMESKILHKERSKTR